MTENTETITPTEDELYSLFRETLPFAIRSEKTARRIIGSSDNTILYRRDSQGGLVAALILESDTVLFLGVRENYRRRGIGSELLSEAEKLVKTAGYSHIKVGAGKDYLIPGVPMTAPASDESFFLPPDIVRGIDESAAGFFNRRGYYHSWGNCSCFDMHMSLSETGLSFPAAGEIIDGIADRIANCVDIEEVCRCTDDAHPDFTKYYRDKTLYNGEYGTGDCSADEKRSLVLVAEDCDRIAGTLIVSLGEEGVGVGSVGCTAVAHEYRGRQIGVNLVRVGTGMLSCAGMSLGFLGYTYSGLDRMYGYSGYRIRVFWFMAKKAL